MSKKKKILIISAVVLLIILLFLLIWFLSSQKTSIKTPVVTTEPKTEQVIQPRENGGAVTSPTTPAETNNVDTSLQSLAIIFAERYGSYSTESDFSNIYDVMDLMSGSFKTETEKFLASVKAATEYYGVTTRVLTTKVTSSDETSATVEVSTQREESKGSPQNSEIKYQKLILSCLKENAVWKVNGAVWQ